MSLEGPPVAKRAALVTALPGTTLPASTVAAVERAGAALAAARRSKIVLSVASYLSGLNLIRLQDQFNLNFATAE